MKRWWMGWVMAGSALVALAEPVPPGSDDEIRARIKPVGELCRAGDACASAVAVAAGGGTGLSGEAIYGQFCFACHATGVGDAPKLGDATAWAPRIAKGMDALLATSLKGVNLMPPKGTCMNCSEDEMRSAIQHMVDAAN